MSNRRTEVSGVKCKLKVILAERKIRQREFVTSVSMNESHFSRIANGQVIPTLDIAFRIAKALHLTIEDIWQPDE